MKQSIHQWHFERGDLFVSEEFDPELKRSVRTATLQRNGKDVLPPLRDVAIVAMTGEYLTLTGFELEPKLLSSPISYQQSWLVKSPYTNRELGQQDDELGPRTT